MKAGPAPPGVRVWPGVRTSRWSRPPPVPVRLDYEITLLGRTLLPSRQAIENCVERRIEQVRRARAADDRGDAG